MDGGRWGYRMGPAEIHDSMLRDGLDDAFSGKHSGWHTEDLVTRAQLTREVQDRFAERSQHRFSAAQKAGRFADEIVAVQIRGKKALAEFTTDEAPRPDTTLEALAKLRPAFREGGTITAGNSPGLNSGAAAMIVADRAFAEANSIDAMARLVAYGVAAVEPGLFGLGPVPAVRKALEASGWKLGGSGAHRDQRGLRRRAAGRRAGARSARGHHQCRRRRHRSWPSDRRDGCRADDTTSPWDATRRYPARVGHALHRRRSGHRPAARSNLSLPPGPGLSPGDRAPQLPPVLSQKSRLNRDIRSV